MGDPTVNLQGAASRSARDASLRNSQTGLGGLFTARLIYLTPFSINRGIAMTLEDMAARVNEAAGMTLVMMTGERCGERVPGRFRVRVMRGLSCPDEGRGGCRGLRYGREQVT